MAIKKEIFNMGMPWESGYGYSQAVKVDDTIYVSGQVDHDETGKILYPGDMEGQMRQAYGNVRRVLAHFGATMENVVDEILFVVDMESAMKARGRLKDEVFGQSILPAATIVQIQRLALTGFMVEVRIVASLAGRWSLLSYRDLSRFLRPPFGISVFEMLNQLPVLPTTTVWHPS
jgi:2-iminobutanoate/2-iminopropanoate deaminase